MCVCVCVCVFESPLFTGGNEILQLNNSEITHTHTYIYIYIYIYNKGIIKVRFNTTLTHLIIMEYGSLSSVSMCTKNICLVIR